MLASKQALPSHIADKQISVHQVLSALDSMNVEFFWLPKWDGQNQSTLALAPLAVWSKAPSSWAQLSTDLRLWMQSMQAQNSTSAVANSAPIKDLSGASLGGFFGGLSYEYALQMDRVRSVKKRALWPNPVRFTFNPVVIHLDEQKQEWFLTGQFAQFADYADQLTSLWYKILVNISKQPQFEFAKANLEFSPIFDLPVITTLVQAQEYCSWVDTTRKGIAQGDLYQANLAHPLHIQGDEPLAHLFKRIHSHNPSPWACYWNTPEFTLLSNSPELLIDSTQKQLRAKPIAGTRPRGATPAEDARIRKNLLRSPKERAEHLMLVDLVRNDLGKVSKAGTVHVPLLLDREPYRNVTHIVSTVKGELLDECDAIDALAAVFPGGTITGTPKLSSMEYIDSLETHPRGWYTGSVGWINCEGDFSFNILIRTLQIKKLTQGWEAWLHVGAGIVADSNAEREYSETLHKAQAWKTILTNT